MLVTVKDKNKFLHLVFPILSGKTLKKINVQTRGRIVALLIVGCNLISFIIKSCSEKPLCRITARYVIISLLYMVRALVSLFCTACIIYIKLMFGSHTNHVNVYISCATKT